MNVAGGFKATGGKGYSTVPSQGHNKSMEFNEPIQPDSNSFDQVDLGSSSSSREGAGDFANIETIRKEVQ